VQSAKDVEPLIEAGVDGIWVSNHGGRQLDGGPASFDTLEEIAKAGNKRVPIVFDSGVRRGQHIFKALALGADVVGIGRPMIWGLNLGGSTGVTDVFNHLKKELIINMQLAGTHNIEEVKNTTLIDSKFHY
jgi:isopentenyl diphosphate isomerase/L-lactate dehydrogenase-like FMN-dependent dehydrogenase